MNEDDGVKTAEHTCDVVKSAFSCSFLSHSSLLPCWQVLLSPVCHFRGQEMQSFWAARLDGALERCTQASLFSCLSHRPQMMRTQLVNTKTCTLKACS